MIAAGVIVIEIIAKDSAQVLLIEDDDVIQTVPPDAADYSFNEWILPRTPGRGFHLFDAEAVNAALKALSIDTVAVAQQIPRRFVPGERFIDLLRRPLSGRMGGDIEMSDSAAIMIQHDKHLENAKCCRWHREEIDPDDILRMVVEKGPPGL